MIDVVELLQDLIRLPSVNPMGRAESESPFLETRVADFLVERARAWGLPYERHEVSPGRDNVLLRVEGDSGLVLLDAHTDTVPVTGMTISPFEPTLRDGRIYGRGSCDVKGGLAAMLVTLLRLRDLPARGRPAVVLACTVNEEFGSAGARQVAGLWQAGRSQLLPRRPDVAIVAEPTLLNIVVAHKGVVRWKCRTRGRAVHSSRPEQGVNAVYGMARVLAAMEAYARDVVPKLGSHPLVGRPSLSVGTIGGGVSVNTVPDDCTIEIDRRLLPADDPLSAQAAAIEFVAERVADSVEIVHEEPFLISPGLESTANSSLAERLQAAVRATGRESSLIGVPYGTNASAYGRELPAVVFGPGSIEQAHTADEWIATEQLPAAVEVLVRFVGEYTAK